MGQIIKKIAFLCATRVIPVTDWNATNDRPGLLTTYDPTNLVEMIQEAKNNADVSIVFVHLKEPKCQKIINENLL